MFLKNLLNNERSFTELLINGISLQTIHHKLLNYTFNLKETDTRIKNSTNFKIVEDDPIYTEEQKQQ